MLEMGAFSTFAVMPLPTDTREQRVRFIREGMGLTQEEFAAALNRLLKTRGRPTLTRGAFANWEAGGGMSRPNLSALAAFAETSMDWIDEGSGPGPSARSLAAIGERILDSMPRARRGAGPIREPVPIWGQAAGATLDKGALILDGDPIAYLEAPAGIAHHEDIYALEVTGTSMLPLYQSKDPIFVSPSIKPRADDIVIVYEHRSDNGKPVAFLKILVRETREAVICRQLNPVLEIRYLKKPGVTMHRVFPARELFTFVSGS